MKRLALLLFSLLLIATALPLTLAQEDETSGTPVATPLPPDVTPTPIPRPQPVTQLEQDGVTLELYFETLPQGRVGLVHVYGDDVEGASAVFLGRTIDFFPLEGDGYYGLIAAGMEQTPRSYELTIYALMPDEERVTITTQVEVELGGFIQQSLDIPPDRAYLIDPPVERAEFARLASIFQKITPDTLWGETAFRFPVNSDLTSPFGAVRVLNDTVQTRHTGWDLKATIGTPILSAANGKVAFAGPLDIRGNYVIVDHGHGIFSGYAHLSQIHVTRGQDVTQGQILGMSGNTGRSSGPHLHWEINVNGEWVDSFDFMQLWLPTTSEG